MKRCPRDNNPDLIHVSYKTFSKRATRLLLAEKVVEAAKKLIKARNEENVIDHGLAADELEEAIEEYQSIFNPSKKGEKMEHQLTEPEHPVKITDDLTTIRVVIKEMISALSKSQKKSRERSLVITKLEEAEMWAVNAQSKE